MDELVAYSERRVRAGIAALPDGRYTATELLEETPDGKLELRVAATVAGDELELDFAGTGEQHDGKLSTARLQSRRPPASSSSGR